MPRNHDLLALPTPRGEARLAIDRPGPRASAVALLFHGAGGSMDAPVLLRVRDALLDVGITVARLDQPYVVLGRRAPAPAPHLDEVALLAAARVRGRGPLLLGGKSSGARVACRIAMAAGATGVVALGFPLHPPGKPERSRAGELRDAGVPVLVVQGSRDAFGTPDQIRAVGTAEVHEVAGDHSLRTGLDGIAEAVATWVQALNT